jgi:FADH2 O2-dependent halogenase
VRGDEILRAIEPFDVAGLCRVERRNWYPVEAADLLGAAAKLGAAESEIRRLLE